MGGSDDTSLILDLALSNVRELERLAREYRQRRLTREQFIAAVEEISAKLRQQIVALMSGGEDIAAEDIPF